MCRGVGEDLEGGACSHNLYTFGPRPRRIKESSLTSKQGSLLCWEYSFIKGYWALWEVGVSPAKVAIASALYIHGGQSDSRLAR